MEGKCAECGTETSLQKLDGTFQCPYCWEREKKEYEPVPYPDADEIMEDHRAW